jgi:lysophospholipase L1-like esterase
MRIKKNQKIVFIGDSITDCGRRGDNAPLGGGYVKLFSDMLIVRHPRAAVTVINKGIGGDIVPGLRDRWNDDVLGHRPDWVSIKIGINDLHRTLRGDADPVPPSRYREAYTEIVERTRKALPSCKLLLIDPFYISTERSPSTFRGEVLKLLPDYLRVVADLSRTYGTLQVKTHAKFQRLLKDHEPDTFCPEPVHPNLTGHLVIADAVYAALQGV